MNENFQYERVNVFISRIEYNVNKNCETLSHPKPWCNDSGVLNLHPDYYTTIMIWLLYNHVYYSFKIFPRFWLVKTTRIIHHNQLLFSKNYWTIDVKMTSKVQPAADYWTVDRENLGTRLCYIWWAEKQRAKWRNSFKNEKIFWMNNKAMIEFGFRRIWRILQISEGVIHLGLRPLWITSSLICRILRILLSLIQ